MLPLVFSVAVSGDGQLLDTFVEALEERFKGVVVYDRNEEANRPDSPGELPATPKIADIDVLIYRKGSKETATIRRFHRHRLFNYDMKEVPAGSSKLYWLLRQMMEAVDEFTRPVEVPAAITEPEAEPDTSAEEDDQE